MNKNINSPLTKKPNVVELKSFSIDETVERWKSELKLDIKKEFENISEKEIKLFKCQETGLEFFVPQVEGSPLLYKKLQNAFDWYYINDKWEYKIALKDINKSSKCIEIGCGSGAFIEKAINQGINVIGIETSEEAVRKANERNLPVYFKNLDEAVSLLGSQPDIILAFQVLEHISDPLLFLLEIINNLKDGGKIILCVPNKDSFYKFDKNLLDMPPHHQTKWSKEVFENLEKILPIKLTKVAYEPLSHLHIKSWLSAYSTEFRSKKWYGKLLFNRISVPIINKLLHTKLRSLFKGHTIYVTFKKG